MAQDEDRDRNPQVEALSKIKDAVNALAADVSWGLLDLHVDAERLIALLEERLPGSARPKATSLGGRAFLIEKNQSVGEFRPVKPTK